MIVGPLDRGSQAISMVIIALIGDDPSGIIAIKSGIGRFALTPDPMAMWHPRVVQNEARWRKGEGGTE
jgi:hypothetical protein